MAGAFCARPGLLKAVFWNLYPGEFFSTLRPLTEDYGSAIINKIFTSWEETIAMEGDSSDEDHGKLTVHMDVLAYLRC